VSPVKCGAGVTSFVSTIGRMDVTHVTDLAEWVGQTAFTCNGHQWEPALDRLAASAILNGFELVPNRISPA